MSAAISALYRDNSIKSVRAVPVPKNKTSFESGSLARSDQCTGRAGRPRA